MKLHLLSLLQSSAEAAINALEFVTRLPRIVKVWACQRATAENLRTCNERQGQRELWG